MQSDWTFDGHAGTMRSALCSPDGKYIVSAAVERVVEVFDRESGDIRYTLEGHSTPTEMSWRIRLRDSSGNIISFDPKSRYMISTNYGTDFGYSIKLWDLGNGCLLDTFYYTDSSAFSPDGRYLAIATRFPDEKTEYRPIDIWDSVKGCIVDSFDGQVGIVSELRFTADGRYIVSRSASFLSECINVWAFPCGKLVQTYDISPNAHDEMKLSPDGKRILIMANHNVNVFDIGTGDLIQTLRPTHRSHWFRCAAYSPHGKYIYAAYENDAVSVYETASWGLCGIFRSRVQSAHFREAFLSYDDKYVIAKSCTYRDPWKLLYTIEMWDITRKKKVLTMNDIASVAHCPDGEYIVFVSSENTMQVWSNSQGKFVDTMHPTAFSKLLNPDLQGYIAILPSTT